MSPIHGTQFSTQFRFGLLALVLASIARWYFARGGAPVPGNVADLVTGALYGVAIGLMLLGLWRGRVGRSGDGGPTLP